MAYQNVYDVTPLSKAQPKLAFLPVTVDCGSVKLTLLESDLEAYPGMFVQSQQGKYGLKGVFAPYPDKTDFYPWRKQEYVTETTDFISRSRGSRSYPWRVLAITERIRICRSTTWSMPWLLPTVSVILRGSRQGKWRGTGGTTGI